MDKQDTTDLVLRHLAKLQGRRNDTTLLRMRDRLLRLQPLPRDDGEFWVLIKRFDEIALDRRLDGSLQRYQLARETLLEAVRLLREQEERMA